MNRERFDQLYSAGLLNSARAEYLWLPEMEFFPPEQADTHIRTPDGRLDGLTPFAVTGGGDLFCWDAHDRIWLIPPDGGDGSFFAANLGDAVYRRLLEFASDAFGNFCSDAEKSALPPDEADGVISHSEALAMLAEYDAGFDALLSQGQHDVLRALMHGGFDKGGVLLTDDARAALIGAMLYPV